MDHFVKNSSAIAVPIICTSGLDKNTAQTTSLINTDRIQHCYVSNINDKRAGSTTGYTAAAVSVAFLENYKTTCRNIIQEASALWVIQMGLQTKRPPGSQLKTRLLYGQFLHVPQSCHDAVIVYQRQRKINWDCQVHKQWRHKLIWPFQGDWADEKRWTRLLVSAFYRHRTNVQIMINWASKRTRPVAEQDQRIPPLDNIAEKAGFVVFIDNKVVTYYFSDLASTPGESILHHDKEEAVKCVQSLVRLQRWTGKESIHHTVIEVATPIVAHNPLMNGVDWLDQYRLTHATQNWEDRLQMTIFTLFLDLTLSHAFAVYNI